MPEFYRLFMQVEEIENAWYLGNIFDADGREVIRLNFGERLELKQTTPLVIHPTDPPGNPVDFRMTYRGIPIASRAVNDVIAAFEPDAIQRIPVVVYPDIQGYEILNVVSMKYCLDLEHSEYMPYPDDDPATKEGKVRWVSEISILADKVSGHHIFRLAESFIHMIVSAELKAALEAHNFTGLKFIPTK